MAEDHTWAEISRVPVTCTTAGSVSFDCPVCHEKKTDLLPALDHTWTEADRQPATCTEAGFVKRTCSRCGFAASEELPALGSAHTWEETGRTEPTEVAAGLIEYTCLTCGAIKNETIPTLRPGSSMSGFLMTVSDVMTAVIGWVVIVADKVVKNPVLLLVVIISFLGTGVVLFRRLLKL